MRMNRRAILSLLPLVILALLCAGCGGAGVCGSFPASAEEMSVLLEDLGFSCELENEAENTYLYRLTKTGAFLSISLVEPSENEPSLLISLMDLQGGRYEALSSMEKLASQIFLLGERIFPRENKAASIFEQLAAERPEEPQASDPAWSAGLREGDFCYSLSLRYDEGLDYEGLYEFSSLEISSFAAYEARQRSLADSAISSAGEEAVKTVADLPASPAEEKAYFSVLGSLRQIRPASELWPEAPENWRAATLSDDSGEIEVLLAPSCYKDKELAAQREQILLYSPELPFPEILASPLPR